MKAFKLGVIALLILVILFVSNRHSVRTETEPETEVQKESTEEPEFVPVDGPDIIDINPDVTCPEGTGMFMYSRETTQIMTGFTPGFGDCIECPEGTRITGSSCRTNELGGSGDFAGFASWHSTPKGLCPEGYKLDQKLMKCLKILSAEELE